MKRFFSRVLTSSPMLMGLPIGVNISRPGSISDTSRMELLQSSQTRSRESILKLRDMRQILISLKDTSLTCATTLSQHLCTCDGNTLPRRGAAGEIDRYTMIGKADGHKMWKGILFTQSCRIVSGRRRRYGFICMLQKYGRIFISAIKIDFAQFTAQ